MPDFSGRKISVGIGKETTRGTSVAPTFWVPQLEIDFLDKMDKILNDSVFGVLDKFTQAEIVKQWSEGKIGGKVTDRSFGLMLAAIFGQTSTPSLHSGETIVYDHAFTGANSNTGLSLTIARKDSNSNKRHSLVMLKSLEITVVVGEFVKFTAEFVGKLGVTGTDTVTYALDNEFKAKYATVKLATNLAGISGATAVPLKSFKIMISRNVEPYFVFGSNDPAEIFAKDLEVKGDFVLRYTDGAYNTLWANNTNQYMVVDLLNTDVTLGVATNPELKLSLPKVMLKDWKIDQNKDNMVEQTLGFQGLYDTTAAATILATLTNTVASY